MELIDTCWNVNILGAKPLVSVVIELIDTCWNVNLKIRRSFVRQSRGINRYMLECKWRYGTSTDGTDTELIDTCWNVNSTQV